MPEDVGVDMLAAALAAYDAGLCVVRARADGSKIPVGEWKQWQTKRPDRDTVRRWFSDGHPGLGIICGAVSGDLEMLELEGRFVTEHTTKAFTKACKDAGLDLLLRRLVNGYMVTSPSGGVHFLYHVNGPANPNTKLASRPSTPEELAANPKAPVQTLIETRGEGGFVVAAPSHGRTHPTGEAWKVRHGSVATIPTITPDERDALYAVAATFDTVTRETMIVAPVEQRAPMSPWRGIVGESWVDATVDHLQARWTMRTLLEHYGWAYAYEDRHGRVLMTRPGKDEGVSGSINGSDRLCPFSTSVPFVVAIGKHCPTYDLLDVIAAYEHRGDRQAAAREVARAAGIMDAWKAERPPVPAPAVTTPSAPAGVDPATGELVDGPVEEGALGESFWTARPVLEHIRQAARSRLVAPAAVLGAVLARVAAFTPPSTCLPPLVGGEAPLSTYVAFLGRSGAGKSSPMATAAALLPEVPAGCVGPLGLGSGEGLVEAFMELVEETDDNGKKRSVKRQIHHGALFMLDEGQALAEMASRKGATILPVLRTAWSGGDPGQANAAVATKRSLRPGSYAVGIVSLWQNKAASMLLADADGGTPQRFVWLPTNDPGASRDRPPWPGRIDWTPPPRIAIDGFTMQHPLGVHPDIEAEVVDARIDVLHDRGDFNELDAHRLLNLLKLAGLFAVLDGRNDIGLEDWGLAGRILQQSDSVRDWVIAEARRRDEGAVIAAARKTIVREVLSEEAAAQRALTSAAKAVWRLSLRVDLVVRRDASRAMSSKDRQMVAVDDAIAEAVRHGWLVPCGENGWVTGVSP